MRLAVRHTITWRYAPPVRGAAYALRLEPQVQGGQRVLSWRIVEDQGATLSRSSDGYGNVVHMLAVNRPHEALTVLATGEIETAPGDGLLRGVPELLPTGYFLRTTEATPLSDMLRAIAARVAGLGDERERLNQLLLALRESSTGVDVREVVHGFVAAARALGHPARVVSGYLAAPGPQGAHLWAEVYGEALGWRGFDPASGLVPGEAHIRVAVGLDADEAAAVRSARRGHTEETLAMDLAVQQVQGQQ